VGVLGGFVAIADDAQGAVATLETDGFDVGVARFADP